MDESVKMKTPDNKYVEAETVTEDSETSSLSNFTDAVSEANPFLEGISKVKDLIQELEESFRESNNVGSNLILRCVLLRAENKNLIQKIDEKNRNLSTTLFNNHWQFSVLSKNLAGSETKRITCGNNHSRTSFQQPGAEEIDILHKTIGDLQKKLRERDKKIQLLCEKYMYLKTNKTKMENDLKSKILSLEKQLDLTYDIVNEFQNEMEVVMGKSLSEANNTYEALFLQEKLRCSKLMYEKIRLQHEIKRLEDGLRRQALVAQGESEVWDDVKCPLDKSTSEPLMKNF